MRTGLAPTLTGSSLFSFQGTGAVQRRIPSLSRTAFDVKRFFSSSPWEAARKKACLFVLEFCSLERSGPGTAGGGKIRNLTGDVKGFSSRERRKVHRGRRPGRPDGEERAR
jgi:hypothetical protein